MKENFAAGNIPATALLAKGGHRFCAHADNAQLVLNRIQQKPSNPVRGWVVFCVPFGYFWWAKKRCPPYKS